MKRSTNINQILALFIALFVVTAFSACSDVAGPGQSDGIVNSESQLHKGLIPGGIGSQETTCTTAFFDDSAVLFASKNYKNAGTVDYKIEDGNLIVTYTPALGVTITETHLWVGVSLEDMPQSKGNGAPKNGHFPYNGLVNIIPLNDIDGYDSSSTDQKLFIVAHAVVEGSNEATFKKEETAYAGDNDGDSKRWYKYIEWTKEERCVTTGGGIGID